MKKILREVRGVFKIEMKRDLNKVSISCALIFLLLCGFVMQISIGNYSTLKKRNIKFIEVEKKKIDRYVNYMWYGFYGFLMSIEMSPINVIFEKSRCTSELEIFIDNSVRLKISKPQKDGNIFERPTGGSLDLSWFTLTILSVLVLAWGFLTFRFSGDYLKFLRSFASNGTIYIGIFLSRAMLILLVLLIKIFITIIIFLANNINIFPEITFLLVFIFAAYVVMILLLVLGFILGTIKCTARAIISAVLCWLIIVLLWPEVLNAIFSKKAAESIESRHLHQSRKLEILTDFENLIREKSMEAKTRQEMIEINRSLTEKYWDEGFKQIEALEMSMIDDIRKHAEKFHFWSIFSPVTLYKSVNNELGSMGFNEYLRFYEYSLEKFKGFVRYYLDNILYKKNPKVVSYLKDDEFIFKAKSSLPKHFGTGVLLNFFYLIVLILFSYHRFKKIMFPKPENAAAFKELDLKLLSGKYFAYCYNLKDREFPKQLYNVLSGRTKYFTGKIAIDGKYIKPGEKQDFFYIPGPDTIPPYLKTGTLLALFAGLLDMDKAEKNKLKDEFKGIINKKFGAVTDIEQLKILQKPAAIKKPKIIILENFFTHIPSPKAREICEIILKELKSKDNIIIELLSQFAPKHSSFNFYWSIFPEKSVYKEDLLEEKP